MKYNKSCDKLYLWAFDLSMDNTGIAIFDLNTYEPIYITSIKNNKNIY